jgi:hypothetical protein
MRDFGHVKIGSEGEAMIASYRTEFRSGKEQLNIIHPGEAYRVCCPRCHDTRFRLYINHRWGVRDERGRLNLWLIICHNEGCFSSRRVRDDLYDDLEERAGVLQKARVREGKVIDLDSIQIEPPGQCTRLDKLPESHPANRYLANRFYNPERLGRFYGVGYCEQSFWYLAQQRVYAPLIMDGKLRGWQVRYIGEMDWRSDEAPPKWWSCPNMKKSHVIYNFDEMRKFRTGVIVEGPGDVWGFGPMAGATLGDTLSNQQQRLVISAFKLYNGVLLYDPTSMSKPTTERVAEKVGSALKGGLAPVTLPSGDPGSLDRGFMREYVKKEAKAMGVKVSWKRR